MKRLIPLIAFLMLALNSYGQEKSTTLMSIDWCIDTSASLCEIVSVSLPIYSACDSVKKLLTDKISPCFSAKNSILNSLELTPNEHGDGYNLSILTNFPIDKQGTFNGICLINKIPVFLKGFTSVDPMIFSQTSDTINVLRKMNKVESSPCMNYETVYYEELIHCGNENLRFYIESCYLPLAEKHKNRQFRRKKKRN